MCRVLLVDDNAQLLDFYKLVLEQAGHQVWTAETCGDAVRLLVETDPEIVIIDLRMPELEDGLSLIRTVRGHARPAGERPVKVVVISGWVEDLLHTPEKGSVDCILAKPVRMQVLLRSISELALMLLFCLAVGNPFETHSRNAGAPAPYNESNAQSQRA
jgi:two-component system response regulator RstA